MFMMLCSRPNLLNTPIIGLYLVLLPSLLYVFTGEISKLSTRLQVKFVSFDIKRSSNGHQMVIKLRDVRVMFLLLYKHADDAVFDYFPKIPEQFPKISEGFPKLF